MDGVALRATIAQDSDCTRTDRRPLMTLHVTPAALTEPRKGGRIVSRSAVHELSVNLIRAWSRSDRNQYGLPSCVYIRSAVAFTL